MLRHLASALFLLFAPAPVTETEAPVDAPTEDEAPVDPEAPPIEDETDAEPGDTAGAETASAEEDPLPANADLVDAVLPCGLRVIAARDTSLPVAAVVLSIEVVLQRDDLRGRLLLGLDLPPAVDADLVRLRQHGQRVHRLPHRHVLHERAVRQL